MKAGLSTARISQLEVNMLSISHEQFHRAFQAHPGKHILMITNHGIHQWNVIPGLPDTGGQNVFVNQFTDTLERRGLRITIVNRGGYPHPVSGEMHKGLVYKSAQSRILYIEDDDQAFVHKEEMAPRLPKLAKDLSGFIFEEGLLPDMIISHYWDGAVLGIRLNEMLEKPVPHVWIPHSLGSIKKRNVKPFRWPQLKIDERIEVEHRIVRQVDYIADTSTAVREALRLDYQTESAVFLPPCVQTDRFHPRRIAADDEIWSFLSKTSGLPVPEIQRCTIITEISRTDTTKRKNVLIEAFARIHRENPYTFLVVAVDRNEKELSDELRGLIGRLGITSHTAVIGNEWDRLPSIYAISGIYCSPSIMEGFGMSVQEAAATAVPIVGSSLIPFVTEFLMGDAPEAVPYTDDFGNPATLQQGLGALSILPDDIAGFAEALRRLTRDETLRRRMGTEAFRITIPYFTWDTMVEFFFKAVDGVPTAMTPTPTDRETLDSAG